MKCGQPQSLLPSGYPGVRLESIIVDKDSANLTLHDGTPSCAANSADSVNLSIFASYVRRNGGEILR